MLRTARRLTAGRLAARCGVSRSLISQIETGRISPSLDVVRRLAAALEVPIAALFAGEAGPPGRGPLPSASAGTFPNPALLGANGAVAAPGAGDLSGLPGPPRIGLVRRGERKGLRLPRSKITYELLSPDLRGRLQVNWVELAPGERAPEDGFVHPGEECYVVLQGRVRFRVADQEFILEPGDALTFDSSLPHGATNDGPVTVHAISIMSPPSF
jgi:mannose-6-phosphate isomerase-like protein (cupin superfamily)/DNA-binding XRE family transcriptional regulator